MKVAIMQPYFLPYIGYFSLINAVDIFIIFDTPQFIRHGWIERNRILDPNKNWDYIKVPLIKHSHITTIRDVKINNTLRWQEKIKRQLVVYNKAQFKCQVDPILHLIFNKEYEYITALNAEALKVICDYLNINTAIHILSEMDISIPIVCKPDEWALEICKSIGGVTEYYNLSGGMTFIDKNKYKEVGIQLSFHKTILGNYWQGHKGKFVEGLSIIDVLMFNSRNDIKNMMNQYILF